MDGTLAPAATGEEGAGPAAGGTLAPRAEIDTSAPFESVKEAVDRFGGSAVWKSQLKQFFVPEKQHCGEDVDVMKVEEQAAQLEKDLSVKERETLDVLKQLDATKRLMDDLKMRLHKENSEVTEIPVTNSESTKVHPILETEVSSPRNPQDHVARTDPDIGSKQSAGLILMGLKQAKMNLNRTTSNLAGIRTFIELLNCKIEKEKSLLEKTREKLSSDSAKVSSLEEDLNQTTLKLNVTEDAESKNSENPTNISKEIQQLNSKIEKFRKMTVDAKSEVLKLTSEVEQTKASIKTAEIQWLAAKKMEEASKAAESVALAEIKALMSSGGSAADQPNAAVTLSVEEYILLTRKAQEADEISRKKIEAAMLQVDEANRSKSESLMKVQQASIQMKNSRKELEEALERVDLANQGKLAVEEALRRWRSEHGQKKRGIHNSTKFKNYAAQHRRDSCMLDLNGLTLVTDGARSASRPTLSIGQILSMKLMGPEECATGIWENRNEKHGVSLGQILSKKHGALSPKSADSGSTHKQLSAKRKKFAFVGFSLLLAKQNKNKKRRQSSGPR